MSHGELFGVEEEDVERVLPVHTNEYPRPHQADGVTLWSTGWQGPQGN